MNAARARQRRSALTRPRRRKHASCSPTCGRQHPHEHRGVPAARRRRGLEPVRGDGADRGILAVGALVDWVDADMSGWHQERRRRDRARRDEVMRLPVLPVRRHGVIDGPDGDVLACASVGPAGEVVAVWTTPDGLDAVTAATVSAAGASFPDPAAAQSRWAGSARAGDAGNLTNPLSLAQTES